MGSLGQSSLGQSSTFSHGVKRDNTTGYGDGAVLGGDRSSRNMVIMKSET